jgi:hypothetical protein
MNSTTFRPADYPHVLSNLMSMSFRHRDGSIKTEANIYPLAPTIELGGSGLYTSTADFIKLLTSLLRNDGKVLKKETVDLMFNYRIPDESIMKSEEVKAFFDWGAHKDDVGMDYDHCLCGLVSLRDMKPGNKAGSVRWGGGTKSFWVSERRVCIGRRSGLIPGSGLIGTVGFVAFMVRRFWVPPRSCRRRCIESFRARFMMDSKL